MAIDTGMRPGFFMFFMCSIPPNRIIRQSGAGHMVPAEKKAPVSPSFGVRAH